MSLPILGANTLSSGFSVANSVRMNGDARMTITPSTADADKWTFSCWVKRSVISSGSQTLFSAIDPSNNLTELRFNSDDKIDYYSHDGSSYTGRLNTNRVFRDVAAWYHIVAVWDSANGTAGNRMRLYINGVEETSFATDTNPSSGQDSYVGANLPHYVGDKGDAGQYFKGYMAEVYYCNGQAYAASDFGEFDEDSPTIWKPKDASGLTFGTGGFYLDFEDSANLGNDANGGTDLTESGLAATDSSTDTPTNNFATMNPLYKAPDANTFSEGNCQVVTHSDNYFGSASTIGVASGKWYFEVEFDSGASIGMAGITSDPQADAQGDKHLGKLIDSYGIYGSSGNFLGPSDGSASYGSAISDGEIVGVYMDLDNNKIYFSVDGSLVSATGKTIVAPASTANTGLYFFGVGDGSSGSVTMKCNFGGCSAFTVSSGNTDDNGYGNFEYSPNITGDGSAKKFYALCTKNLAEYG